MPNATLQLATLIVSACLALSPAVGVVKGSGEPPSVILEAVPEYLGHRSYDFSGAAIHDDCPIASVEYSCDYGSWLLAIGADGAFGDSTIEGFAFTIDSLADGAHVVRVRATTSAGHTTPPDRCALASFIVDTVHPFLGLGPLSPDPTSDAAPALRGWAEDSRSPIAGVQYSIDGGDWLTGRPIDGAFDSPREDYAILIAALCEGQHIVVVRAEDAAGNMSDLVTNTFIIDTHGPRLIMDGVPAYVSGSALVCSGQAADLHSEIKSVRFCLDQGEWLAATPTDGAFDESIEPWEFSVSDLTEGGHSLRVNGVDALGNVTLEREEAVACFTADSVAPSVSVLFVESVAAGEECLVVRGLASDRTSAVIDVEWRVDGGDWAAAEADDGSFDGCDEPFLVAASEVLRGEYLIDVRAMDAAGNISSPASTKLMLPSADDSEEEYREDSNQLTGGADLHRTWWLTLLLPGLTMAGLVIAVAVTRRSKEIGVDDVPGE